MQIPDTITAIPFVDLNAQYASIKRDIDHAITEVLESTAFIGGPFVGTFEQEFARYCHASHCVGVGNGTDALFIALRALGIGPGDEVITAANSFIATSEAIRMAGANVVFADVDPATYNIATEGLEKKVTPRTKAILPVHLYGQPADMLPIRELATRRGLYVVGDAAQAHGAKYRGIPICQLADVTCFSFYPGKNLGAYGDAGAIVTDNETWAAKARMLANHGRTNKYDHEFEGVNSRLDGLQAAILTTKLRHLERWTDQRRANASRYNHELEGMSVITPQESPGARAVYHLYVVRVPDGRRDELRAYLGAQGISTGIHYPIPLPFLNAYRHLNHTEHDFPVALKASREILSLPMYPELTESQVQLVAEKIGEYTRVQGSGS
jgi:dTDP-4-amino-4,6-dideoxygalactose transaminase